MKFDRSHRAHDQIYLVFLPEHQKNNNINNKSSGSNNPCAQSRFKPPELNVRHWILSFFFLSASSNIQHTYTDEKRIWSRNWKWIDKSNQMCSVWDRLNRIWNMHIVKWNIEFCVKHQSAQNPIDLKLMYIHRERKNRL